jgi:hypothetical protein
MDGDTSLASSAAWILLAVLMHDPERGGDLVSVISTADYINHAIPPYEELARALEDLLASGLIEEGAGRYRAAPAVRAAYAPIEAKHRAIGMRLDDLDRWLQGEVGAGRTAPLSSQQPLSRQAYEQAVSSYLERFWRGSERPADRKE